MNTRAYDTAVDVWAAGCILAELMLRIPYLPGESDLDQLQKIFQALGTPQEGEWPVSSLPGVAHFSDDGLITFSLCRDWKSLKATSGLTRYQRQD
jgi:serine/threonine protein kinase